MSSADLVIKDLAMELADMEMRWLEAVSEGAGYRHTLLAALDQLQQTQQKAFVLERRLQQVMGFQAWHPEEL